jgi:hypothetical protein
MASFVEFKSASGGGMQQPLLQLKARDLHDLCRNGRRTSGYSYYRPENET